MFEHVHIGVVTIGALVLFLACLWANFSPLVNDGIVGKIILFFMALSALVIFSKSIMGYPPTDISITTLIVSNALYWVRKIFLLCMLRKYRRRWYDKNPSFCRREKNNGGS